MTNSDHLELGAYSLDPSPFKGVAIFDAIPILTLSDGLCFHARDLDDLHVATWGNKGLTYALISSVAMGSSRSCSTCHRNSPDATTALKDSHATFWHTQVLPEVGANQVRHFPF